MERPVAGDVVVVPFPFADLTGFKRRPAVVVARASKDDLILCQVTSRDYGADGIRVATTDFANGSLPHDSFARTDKLFTASRSIVIRTAGRLAAAKSDEIRDAVIARIRA